MSNRPGKRPLRIAMLVNDFPRVSQTFVLSQISDLIERGHEISIFSRNITLEKVIHRDVLRHKLFRKWTLIPMRQGKFNTMKRRWGPLAPTLIKLISRTRTFSYLWKHQHLYKDAFFAWKPWRTRFDVIHAHFGPAGHWSLSLDEMGIVQGPLTVSIRGYDAPQMKTAAQDALLWSKADVIQPSSKSLAKIVQEFGCPPEKCRLIYSGINLSRFQLREAEPPRDQNLRILSVGRLVEKKGVTYALEGFALLLKSFPNAVFDVVGDGPLREELETKSKALGLSSHVFFHGPRSHTEIMSFLTNCHVFWATSVTASNGDVEGDLNTIKEALAVGVPTVATRHGGIPEIIEHEVDGLLVPEKDPAALAGTTIELVAHPERWPSMKKNGRAKVERLFEHNALIDHLEDIYYQMADQSPEVLPVLSS